jgi:hypothetical protein
MRAVIASVLALIPAVALVACGSSDQVDDGGFVSLTTGVGGGGGGLGDDSKASSTVTTAGTGGSAPEVCPDASGVYTAEPAQSNLLFLVDRSGSMHLKVGTNATRWSLMQKGLFEILDALPASTVGGLALFPYGDKPITCCGISSSNIVTCNCAAGQLPDTTKRCNPTQYHNLPVPLAPMSSIHVADMKTAVSKVNSEFYWGTPLTPALTGAIESLVAAKQPGVSSIILLTDGQPTSCDTANDPGANDIQRAVDAVTAGSGKAIRTYVVGIYDTANGADPTYLSKIAHAAGTDRYAGCTKNQDCAYPVNAKNFDADLANALQEIALEAMSCSFEVPSVMGGKPDFDKVNITITADGKTITVPHDTAHQNGWDYLSGNQQVQLYGDACSQLKADASASVQVVVGCKTQGN